jgi:flavin reductase (DIM6/NTAB) family NADH-FMN oxidoreductase RutF
VDSGALRRTCSRFATGITVATTNTPDGRPVGFTANSFTSVSADPPLVLLCIDYRSSVLPFFRSARWFGINVLAEHQQSLSVRFSQRELANFCEVNWHAGEYGVPLLDGVLATFECSVHQIVEAGDHSICIGQVLHCSCSEGDPLVYYGSRYRHLAP